MKKRPEIVETPGRQAVGASCVADLPVVLASLGWLAVSGR